jgi:predicted small integral membrane protein
MQEQMQAPSPPDQGQKTLPLANASFVLGFLSCVMLGIFSAIPAVICGHISLSKLKREPTKYTNKDKRIVIAGLILGYLGIIISIIFAVIMLSIFFDWDLGEIRI